MAAFPQFLFYEAIMTRLLTPIRLRRFELFRHVLGAVALLAAFGHPPSAFAQTRPPATAAGPAPFDLVIANGRVIDPETGLDDVRAIGIRDGRIASVSRTPLTGKVVLDARGLVVAPGFIDMHAHGQEIPAARMQAFDGVTTALELESGTLPVGVAYDRAAKEGRPINYGFAASWLYARIAEKEKMEPDGAITFFQDAQRRTGWQFSIASPEEAGRIVARVERGLQEGAIGIGVLAGYAPGYGRKEAFAVAQLAARLDVPTFTHVRYLSVIEPQSSFEAMSEIVSLAAATGARMHIAHLNSSSTRDIARIAELLRGAQARGLRITTEAYPYGAGSTVVGAELFRGNWRERMGGAVASDIERGGVPFNDATLAEAQEKTPGDWIVVHFMRPDRNAADQALLDESVLFPGGAIASDAMPWTLNGQPITGDIWPLPDGAFAHPRSAGTFTRFLRDYVRERRKVTLSEGLRRMTLIPAKILEGSVPQMRRKGRLQVGADADLVAFDLATVSERGTFIKPNQTAAGMRHVIVNGTPVIRDGALVRDALPGRAIRRAVTVR
ncbi:MAG TPA: amidohydrolase family protein [Casimicrobiaceae bacterium]|nr:amidohydrolase family protein [Casimicrobiaceae bacterium]